MGAASTTPAFDHIVVVIEENHAFAAVIGNPQAPYLNALAQGGAVLSNYHAITHPSQPNYFALYAGSTFGIADSADHTLSGPTLATILQASGNSFVGYIEPASPRRHNPWESFPEGTSVERTMSAFPSAANFSTLPDVAFVVPDLTHDMHDGTVAAADQWLKTNLDAYAQWAVTHHSLLVVVWDEDDSSAGNQVPVILYGANVNPGTYGDAYTHYDLLATLAGASGLTGPNNAASATGLGGGIFPVAKAHWSASVDVGPHATAWVPAATGDFNRDGTGDMLWFNAVSNNVEVWTLQNGKWSGSFNIGSHPAGWTVVGTGDFNRDGTSDVLWYNATNGDAEIWKIQNGKWAGSVDLGSHPAGWVPAGTGDFNRDGTSDVLWYNAANGDAEIWKTQNGQWAGSVDIGKHPLGWQPAGVGDFNHDGTSDIVWFNPTTLNVELWLTSNGQWAGSIDLGAHPAGWQPSGVGDFNHDGTSDLLWLNAATNRVEIWQIVNGRWAGSVDLGSHPTGWTVAAVGDFNGDGTSDIAWRETATGRIENWLLG